VKRADDNGPTPEERHNAWCKLFAIFACVALLVLLLIGALTALAR
jgi:hypothetical protein